jgi:putative endonuclease
MTVWLYMLRCADGRYYVGTARDGLERRISEHEAGTYGGWTAGRGPFALVFSQPFEDPHEAIAAERRLKGWSRAKKQALIAGDWQQISVLAKRKR